MAITKVKGVEYSVDSISFGAKSCDKCNKLCGCARVINPTKHRALKVYICYTCSGGHWKKALKIAIGIFPKEQQGCDE